MERIKQTTKTSVGRVKELTQPIGHGRLLRLFAVSLIVWSVALPVAGWISDRASYQLSAASQKVIGEANPNLTAKFTFDATRNMWQFNKSGTASQAAALQAANPNSGDATGLAMALSQMHRQVGGGGKYDKSLFSVDLPVKSSEGMTYYDNNTNLSFKMTPEFKSKDGKLWQGRVVYPASDGVKMVYTAKPNGLKEDIVLTKLLKDSVSYSYNLDLPKTLEARLRDDGSVGVFSADPALFAATASEQMDQAKLDSARETADKDHLVFVVPAPIVKDSKGQETKGEYTLDGTKLRVVVSGLSKLSYPLSVDPSVAITSTSDFTDGNNEGMIDYSVSGEIDRSEVSGGSIGSWSSTNSIISARSGQASTAYNGYMYMLGGTTGTMQSDVQFAGINSNGTVNAWHYTHNSTDDSTTFVSGFTTARYELATVAYNGYIYVLGGNDGTNYLNDVQYAPLNSNGTVGTWASTSSFIGVRYGHAAVAYNGYMYVLGGWSGSAYLGDVQYAPINADGTVGSWHYTHNSTDDGTSFSAGFTTARNQLSSVVYNGYIYVIAGNNAGVLGDVQYAPLNSNGTVGTWATTTTFTTSPTTRTEQGAVAYNGFMYVYGGYNGSSTYYNDVQIAQINANGTVGNWRTVSGFNFTTARKALSPVVYNGYIYVIAGTNGTAQSGVQYSKIDATGSLTSLGSLNRVAATSVNGAYTIAYNGFLYHIGGFTTVGVTSVNYASIAADGTIGTWTAANALNTAAWYGGYAIYNGILYVFGGFSSAVVQYATINTNGSLGTWTTDTAMPTQCGNTSGTGYNGYLYIACSASGGNGQTSTIKYAPINSNGTVGTWNATTASLPNVINFDTMVAYAGYLYVVGGNNASSVTQNTVTYGAMSTSTGDIATFSATSTLNVAVQYANVGIVDGYMYRIGGENNSGGTETSTEFAKINSNGTLGTWTTGNSLGTGAEKQVLAVWGNYYYLISGAQTSRSTASQYGIINADTGFVTGSWTTNSTDLSGINANGTGPSGGFVYKGYVYSIGGSNATDGKLATVASAPLNADGSIGTWTAQNSMNTAKGYAVTVVYGDYVYVYTGLSSSADTNTLEYAQLSANGGIGTWSSDITMNLSAGSISIRDSSAGFAYNGYLYLLGGVHSGTYYSDAYYAPINSNGTIGTWASTTSFTTGRKGTAAVAYNGYAYIIGGTQSSSVIYNDVQFSAINSGNGTLGTWNVTNSLIQPRALATAVIAKGRIYLFSGTNSAGGLRTVEQVVITPSGKLGNWELSATSQFTNQRVNATAFAYNGKLYLMAGQTATVTTAYNDIQYVPLSYMAPESTYSVLVDLGTAATISSVNYNGTLSAGSTVQYKSAGTNGVFGSLTAAASGSGSPPSGYCAPGTTRYAWITVTLDDTAIYLYVGGTPSGITDLTVNYGTNLRPDPSQRLYGGKWFKDQAQMPLDTCGA